MEEHLCNQEKVISEMHTILKSMVKQIYGNGQPGLSMSIPRMEGKINNLVETVSELRTTVSALAKYQASVEGVVNYKDKQGLNARQRTALWISGISGFCGIVVSLIIKLL
jgi:hypothetical protein